MAGLHHPGGGNPALSLGEALDSGEDTFVGYVNVLIDYGGVKQVAIHLFNTRGLLETLDEVLILEGSREGKR